MQPTNLKIPFARNFSRKHSSPRSGENSLRARLHELKQQTPSGTTGLDSATHALSEFVDASNAPVLDLSHCHSIEDLNSIPDEIILLLLEHHQGNSHDDQPAIRWSPQLQQYPSWISLFPCPLKLVEVTCSIPPFDTLTKNQNLMKLIREPKTGIHTNDLSWPAQQAVREYYKEKEGSEFIVPVNEKGKPLSVYNFMRTITSHIEKLSPFLGGERRTAFFCADKHHAAPFIFIQDNSGSVFFYFDSMGALPESLHDMATSSGAPIYYVSKKSQKDWYSCRIFTTDICRLLTAVDEHGDYKISRDRLLSNARPHPEYSNIFKITLIDELLPWSQVPEFIAKHQARNSDRTIVHHRKNDDGPIQETLADLRARHIHENNAESGKHQMDGYLTHRGLKQDSRIRINYYLKSIQESCPKKWPISLRKNFISDMKEALRENPADRYDDPSNAPRALLYDAMALDDYLEKIGFMEWTIEDFADKPLGAPGLLERAAWGENVNLKMLTASRAHSFIYEMDSRQLGFMLLLGVEVGTSKFIAELFDSIQPSDLKEILSNPNADPFRHAFALNRKDKVDSLVENLLDSDLSLEDKVSIVSDKIGIARQITAMRDPLKTAINELRSMIDDEILDPVARKRMILAL